jgi:cephalosporin hydroxylase
MSPRDQFLEEVRRNIEGLKSDKDVQALSRIWLREITRYRYAYNFSWMGRPIIQFPQDMVAVQEIMWACQPDLVIETGIAHGGSIIYYASLMQLMGKGGKVLGIDIDIRSHNREAIESHPMYPAIELLEGSSVDEALFEQVRERAEGCNSVMVVLDSNHTHEHVLRELELYSRLVTPGNYLIVFDTLVEDMPADLGAGDRPWGIGDNPKTAVHAFLEGNDEFVIDRDIEAKLLITVAPDGFLKRVES